MKKNSKKSTRKTMTAAQLTEWRDLKHYWQVWRETVYTAKAHVREAKTDVREAQANLGKEIRELARAEKNVASAKKALDQLSDKYKGWARPSPKGEHDDSGTGVDGTGDGSHDQVVQGLP